MLVLTARRGVSKGYSAFTGQSRETCDLLIGLAQVVDLCPDLFRKQPSQGSSDLVHYPITAGTLREVSTLAINVPGKISFPRKRKDCIPFLLNYVAVIPNRHNLFYYERSKSLRERPA